MMSEILKYLITTSRQKDKKSSRIQRFLENIKEKNYDFKMKKCFKRRVAS